MKIQALIQFIFQSIMIKLTQSENTVTEILQDKMIWNGNDKGRFEYTVFRKTFELSVFDAASIHLYKGSRYIYRINEQEILCCPFSFDPKFPTFDSMVVTSFIGENLFRIIPNIFKNLSNDKFK